MRPQNSSSKPAVLGTQRVRLTSRLYRCGSDAQAPQFAGFVRLQDSNADLAVLGVDNGSRDEGAPPLERASASQQLPPAAASSRRRTGSAAGTREVAPSASSSTSLLPPAPLKLPRPKKGGGPLDDLVSLSIRSKLFPEAYNLPLAAMAMVLPMGFKET